MEKKLKKALATSLATCLTICSVFSSAQLKYSTAAKKKVKLDKKSVTVYVGKTVKIKLKNNKKKTKWTIISGKKYVSLSKKKKTSVTIKGKKPEKQECRQRSVRKST